MTTSLPLHAEPLSADEIRTFLGRCEPLPSLRRRIRKALFMCVTREDAAFRARRSDLDPFDADRIVQAMRKMGEDEFYALQVLAFDIVCLSGARSADAVNAVVSERERRAIRRFVEWNRLNVPDWKRKNEGTIMFGLAFISGIILVALINAAIQNPLKMTETRGDVAAVATFLVGSIIGLVYGVGRVVHMESEVNAAKTAWAESAAAVAETEKKDVQNPE